MRVQVCVRVPLCICMFARICVHVCVNMIVHLCVPAYVHIRTTLEIKKNVPLLHIFVKNFYLLVKHTFY